MSSDLKVYNLEDKLDFMIYLCELIIAVYKSQNTIKRYLKELDERINELSLRENAQIRIQPEEYFDFNNKISNEESAIMNNIGDLTNTAMSYYKFRKIYEKRKKNGLDFELDDLNDEISHALKEINESRNWGLHIPESLLNAKHEIYGKETQKNPKTSYSFNPILIAIFEKYEGTWLVSLYNEKKNNYNTVTKVLTQMKRDYSKIIGESMQIQKKFFEVRKIDDLEIPRTSFDIQKRKRK